MSLVSNQTQLTGDMVPSVYFLGQNSNILNKGLVHFCFNNNTLFVLFHCKLSQKTKIHFSQRFLLENHNKIWGGNCGWNQTLNFDDLFFDLKMEVLNGNSNPAKV